jgi:imidazoleglycerol-phosphate dehydratase
LEDVGEIIRTARVERATGETKTLVELALDGSGIVDVETGVGFFDHMLHQLGRHAGFDLTVHTVGDLRIDAHHSVQETSMALGEAFRDALAGTVNMRRFGSALVPVDEALVQVALDVAGRPYLVHTEPAVMECVVMGGNFPGTLVRHVWESFVRHAQVALHVNVQAGRDTHHIAQAQFCAVGRALRDAVRVERLAQPIT